MPIMPMSEREGNTPFWTRDHHAMMGPSSSSSEPLMPASFRIGLLVFPNVTQLDFTGPLQVFSSLPGATVHLIWKTLDPVPSDSVLMLTPTMTFADCPQLD